MPSGPATSGCGLIGPLAGILALLLLGAPARTAGPEPVSREVFLMGTRAILSTWSDTRATGLLSLERLLRPLEQTEAQLSTWLTDSEVSQLNASAGNGPARTSPSLCRVLNTLDYWTHETQRTFDSSIGALVAAWQLHGRGRVPARNTLDDALRRSGWHRVTFDADACTLQMPAGMALDVGAFGKGEALDRARAAVEGQGMDRDRGGGIGDPAWLIDLGGQIAVGGAPPGRAGWQINVAHPERRGTPVLQFRLAAGSVATSAGSERDLRVGRRRIGHILDPRTGRPATFTGSATVWHEQALAADILSTALFVMGPEKGIDWAEPRGVAVVYLIPGAQGTVVTRASSAFSARFRFTS